jgi:formate hydrogenlyase subunit 4
MMAYEPMVLLTAIGMYMVTKSFYVHEIASHPTLLVLTLPGIFLGFLYTLEIKFRKSPFDLSSSHHAHQELVRGMTTEFSGRALGCTCSLPPRRRSGWRSRWRYSGS